MTHDSKYHALQGLTPLHMAAGLQYSPKLVKMLIRAGADANVVNSKVKAMQYTWGHLTQACDACTSTLLYTALLV